MAVKFQGYWPHSQSSFFFVKHSARWRDSKMASRYEALQYATNKQTRWQFRKIFAWEPYERISCGPEEKSVRSLLSAYERKNILPTVNNMPLGLVDYFLVRMSFWQIFEPGSQHVAGNKRTFIPSAQPLFDESPKALISHRKRKRLYMETILV